jgi:glutaminyl-peptide cyclotransferase
VRYVLAAGLLLVAACAPDPPPDTPSAERVQVLEERPHDTAAFTQGLELKDGELYEGTGELGESSIRAVDPASGRVLRKADLPGQFFGEGITVVGTKIWQLTWRNGVAIERDRQTLAETRRVEYSGEGWGLCSDGRRLIMSDGTDLLTFRDPQTFAKTGEVRVRRVGEPVTQLNELECANGSVYANVWHTDEILRIDPASGRVSSVIDATGLLPDEQRDGENVLNGIAAIPGTDRFLITGKRWPRMFVVKFVPAERR